MKKLIVFGLITLLAISGLVLAKPNFITTEVNTPKGPVPVMIPAHAVQVADDVFDLGTAEDVDGRLVQGYMIIDRRSGNAKPPWAGGGNGASKCYAFLANGAKWKTIEPWVVNPANTEELNESLVFSNLGMDIQKWETASSYNILGYGSTTTATLYADTASPDGVNEVYFGDVGSSGAIAVTIVWGIFSGPPSQRKLVEWDQIYDEVDYHWSLTGEAGKMDFDNIATHEVGHSVGMAHPDDSCTEETMYRFASLGETKKRDLNTGDIAGINELY